jgi:hypothetical protein
MASRDLPGDQIELVAFDVGEGRPAGLVSLQVAEPLGAQAQQAHGLGIEGVADEIEVEAVLDASAGARTTRQVRPGVGLVQLGRPALICVCAIG